MNLRPRTVRRLMILLAAVLVLVGIGAALYLRNEHRKADKIAAARAAGMTAYKAGDYHAALEPLGFVVARNKTDAEALYAYGVARTRIEEPNGAHILEGIKAFRAVLDLDHSNLEAKHTLLDLYTQVFYSNEALELADNVLAAAPNDVDALRAKCYALERSRKYAPALAASEKINELQPNDLYQQVATYRLMHLMNRPPAELTARAQKLRDANPGNPRFEMLLALVYDSTGDSNRRTEALRQAATLPAPDATYVRYMMHLLDSRGMYKETQDMLEQAVARDADPKVMCILMQRLWQNGKLAQVEDRLKTLDPASPSTDTGLIAYRALALFEMGKTSEANQLVAALAERKTDNEAIAWSTALGSRFGGEEAKAALGKYQAALVRMPDNAVIRYLVGEAYARLGETELAIAAWRKAGEMAPSWAGPHLHTARTLAAANRLKEAVDEAGKAYLAGPDQPTNVVTFLSIQYRALEQGVADPAVEPRLLDSVTQLQKADPGEPETLPAYVSLLVRAGRRDEAIAAVRTAMSGNRKYRPATISSLLAVSRSQHLGLEAELRKNTAEPDGPRAALARAGDLASSGKPQEGLALLQSQAKVATSQPTQWQLALTQYKEAIQDPSAAGDWITLGDANPDDLAIQASILKSAASARGDRDFFARTIDRVKNLTGPEGQTWKIERARWLIGGDSSKDAAEAVNTLTDIVRQSPTLIDARMLLASAYEAVGNTAAAVKELQAASELEPANASVAIALSRALQQQGRFADARTYLERTAAPPDLPSDTRRTVAGMLAAQGDLGRGVKVLRDGGDKLDSQSQLLLADLLRRQRHFSDAEAIYAKLLATPPISVETIRAAADFYGTQGKVDAAKEVLGKLAGTSPRPGSADLIVAAFNERFVGDDAARKSYITATSVAPNDPLTWRLITAFYLRTGRYDEAEQAADDGLKFVAGDVALVRLRLVAVSCSQLLSTNAALRPVVSVLAAAAPEDRGASEFLTAPDSATSQPAGQSPTDALLARLQLAAERHPRSLPLQDALVQWHVARQELVAAAKVASATMDAFPTDPQSARIAATIYRNAGQLDLAAAAAQRWRERTPENPAPADRMLADIRLSQGDAGAALKVLEPYKPVVTADPQSDPATLQALLRALAMAGREDEARVILEPLIAKDPAWRSLWMQIAASDIKQTENAEAWLRQVGPIIPADDVAGQVDLASAWNAMATRTRTTSDQDESAKLLDPIVARADAPARAILLRGAIAEHAGDAKSAEALYRRGLVLSPDEPGALNNLAYLILQRGGDLVEARTMVDRAISLAPATASFYDTLARIEMKQSDRDAAIVNFNKALKLDPTNLEALVGLASALRDAGKRESAAGLLAQIDAIVLTKPPMSPELKRELESLRATMKASL